MRRKRGRPARWVWVSLLCLCTLSACMWWSLRQRAEPVVLMEEWRRAGGDSLAAHLSQIESAQSNGWNNSRTAVVLGQKASRDFGVYAWAFSMHNFRIIRPPEGVITVEGDRPARLPGIGAVLCHSIFTVNCIRKVDGDVHDGEARDARVYTRIGGGRKINRISGAHPVLTTKDGFCGMLRATRLTDDQLQRFAFPCWSLPADLPALRTRLLTPPTGGGGGGGGSGGGGGGGMVLVDSGRWIVKPRRGSMGEGIRVVDAAQLRQTVTENANNLSYFIVQPYLGNPLLRRGRKWDVRTYVLVTSVIPARAYLFTEAIVRYASTSYSTQSSEAGVVLTNTYVGKRILKQGVREITGSLADLCPLFSAGAPHAPNRCRVHQDGTTALAAARPPRATPLLLDSLASR